MVPALGLLFSWTGVLVVFLSIVHVIVCIFLLAVVLLQRGRTGDVMAAFGGPTPSSYAALSTDDLLTRLTKVGAATFMLTSLCLALMATRGRSSVIDELDEDPAATATAPADATATAPVEGATGTSPGDGTITLTPTPVEGATTPVDGATAPAEGATTPAEGATAPADGGATAPADGGAGTDGGPGAGATAPTTP